MNFWFLSDDARLTIERTAVAALDERAPWLGKAVWTISGSRLAVEADILVGETSYPVVLEYPVLFPASPPTVSPREADARWSAHQYRGSGELCLEWGPDNWDPQITGAALLESAYRLLSTERVNGDGQRSIAPSRHESSLGQDLRGSFLRVAATEGLEGFLASLGEGTTGTFNAQIVWRDNNATMHVLSIQPEDSEAWCAQELPKTIQISRCCSLTGRFARTGTPLGSFAAAPYSSLIAALKGCACDRVLQTDDADRGLAILLLAAGTSDVRFYSLPKTADGSVMELPTFRADVVDWRRTGANPVVLAHKRVGIVGVGSAGSKIALTLARSGVRDFLLVDDDIFLPENIERHTLDYRNVGEHKVDGVKEQLEALSFDIRIEVSRLKLSGQEASSSVANRLQQLRECDVIVDATADSRTFNALAETARQSDKPLVWLEVFAGGIGGLVARSRPGKDPDPFSARARLHSYLEDKPSPPGASVVPYAGQGDDGELLVAADAEVGIIALHAARFVSDILEEREPSAFPSSHYLIGLNRGWLFEAPFHTIELDTGDANEQPTGKAESLSKDNIAFIGEVIQRGASQNGN